MMSPTARALSAPIHAALHVTGQGFQSESYWFISKPPQPGQTQIACRSGYGRRVVGPPQPPKRSGDLLGAFDRELDPAAAREAPMRTSTLGQRAGLILGAQPDPEVSLSLAQ